jgi:hypothetical protein
MIFLNAIQGISRRPIKVVIYKVSALLKCPHSRFSITVIVLIGPFFGKGNAHTTIVTGFLTSSVHFKQKSTIQVLKPCKRLPDCVFAEPFDL